MVEGELYKQIHEKVRYAQGVSYAFGVKPIIEEAQKEFPVKYFYDAWEIPETKAQSEKQLCKVIAWYQKWFGSPVNSEVVKQ